MPKTDFQTVDEYIAVQPKQTQVALELVRKTIRKALPAAEEVISYRIPAYKLRGAIVLYFAGWKENYSLYPAGKRLVSTFGNLLALYAASKGTIRFPLSEPVPVKLIERIAKFRLEAAQRENTNPLASRKSASQKS